MIMIMFNIICDRLCKSPPCLHLLVIKEKLKLKLTTFACTRLLLFSRTGLTVTAVIY